MKRKIIEIFLSLILLSTTAAFNFDLSIKFPFSVFETDYTEIYSPDAETNLLFSLFFPGYSIGITNPICKNGKTIGEIGIAYLYENSFHFLTVFYDAPMLVRPISEYTDFIVYMEPAIGAGLGKKNDLLVWKFNCGCNAVFAFEQICFCPYIKCGINYDFATTKVSRLSFPIFVGLRLGQMVEYKH